MDIVRLVFETVLELPECGRFLWRLLLFFIHLQRIASRSGRATAGLTSRLLSDLMSLARLNTLQVDFLHVLQLIVGLRVAAGALAEITESVIFVKIEFRAFEVLVDIFTEHLFKLVVTIPLLGVDPLGLPHVVQVLRFFVLGSLMAHVLLT